jgi:hypothetical protein
MRSRWHDISIEGTDYDLSHLHPFTVKVTPKADGAPTFKVYVSFGSHTFTKEWLENDNPAYLIKHDGERRCFCPIRYGHSLHLPAIIHKGVNGKAYFSQTRNFLLVENLPGINGPYAVFFKVEKAKSKDFDVAMFVVSAYEKPDLPRRLPKITFATLISKTANGQPIMRPKK